MAYSDRDSAGARDKITMAIYREHIEAAIKPLLESGFEVKSIKEVPQSFGNTKSVSDITGNMSLMLFFVTDTRSALTAAIISVTPTVFFVAKTIRSVRAIHCFIAKLHCFLKLQHCSATELICFIASQNNIGFSKSNVTLPQNDVAFA